MLKSFWTRHLQMMNRLEPPFSNWTGRQKWNGTFVDETHLDINLFKGNNKIFYTFHKKNV